MKRKVLNLILTVSIVAVIATGTAIVRSINDKKEKIESEEETPLLSNVEKSDLRRIEILNSDGAFDFTSDDGEEWTSNPPTTHFRWDKDKIGELIDTVSKLQSLRLVEDSPSREKMDEYGLAHPEATLILHDSRELKISLLVGDSSPVGSGRYASNDTDLVYLISESDAEIMLKKVTDYRDISLPSVSADADSIRILEYRQAGNLIKIIKEDDKLVMVEPWRADVDKDLFTSITGAGAAIPREVDEYKDQFLWNAPFFGLNNPNADYLLVEDDEDNKLHIIIGGVLGGSQHYSMLGDREDSVFLINKINVKLLNNQPFDFIEKSVVEIPLNDISEIRVDNSEKQWLIKKKGLGFDVNGKKVSEVDVLSVYDKLTQIVRHDLAPEANRTGKPDVELTINSKDGDREIELRDYDESSYAATISGNEVDFLVTRAQIDFLIEELIALQDEE